MCLLMLLYSIFSDCEAFMLFVSCLGHDIDHRGTTNSYQKVSVSISLFALPVHVGEHRMHAIILHLDIRQFLLSMEVPCWFLDCLISCFFVFCISEL